MRALKRITGLFLTALMLLYLSPLQYLDFSWMAAHASGELSIDLTYPGSKAGYEAVYSSSANSTTNPVTVTAPAGKTISQINVFRDGNPIATIPAAVGLATWSGSLTYAGIPRPVVSAGNKTAQGYYAWYRYIPGGSQGLNWYADLLEPDGRINCASSTTERIGAYNMPMYPGCSSSNLSMSGTRDKGYFTTDTNTPIPSEVVSISKLVATSQVDGAPSISGPAGVSSGFSDWSTSDGTAIPVSADSFTVRYAQDFDHDSGYSKELGNSANGAKVMVYYAAFIVKLTSETYKYPDHIQIIYSGTPSTLTPSPTATPVPISITGDFQLTPPTINYRDSFTLHPLLFTIPSGCTYSDHYYKIERGGTYIHTSKVYSRTQDTTYSYTTYPYIIAVGSHNISLMIEASCGSSGFIATKTLTVNGPSTNGPPDFNVGWVNPSNNKVPLSRTVVGTTLDLIYINDPSIPTPSDPDGDLIYFDNFDFNSADTWTKTVPSKSGHYTDGYHSILMDTTGYHYVSASMHDQWGASTTRTAMIEVLPPNPVPVCTAPKEVKENRTVAAGAIHAKASYSPLGRTIDHSKDVWSNLKTSYVNGGSSDIFITVTLVSVTDSAGLTSLAGSDCQITLHPDLPPIGKLGVPAFGVRGSAAHIQNQSYSTDGDVIASASYKYKYDVNNDGFTDDSWQAISGNLSGFDFTPAKVGKYLFYVNSCEDYGRCGDNSSQTASEITLDVVNKDGPVVSFDIEGENNQPSVVPTIKYTAGEILTNWNLFQTNTNTSLRKEWWTSSSSGQLTANLGRGLETPDFYNYNYYQSNADQYRQYVTPAQNYGLGLNAQSPYRSFSTFGGSINKQPILIPGVYANTWVPVSWSATPVLRTTSDNIYFSTGYMGNIYSSSYNPTDMGGYSLYNMNKHKIGRYAAKTDVCSGCTYPTIEHQYLDGSPYDFAITAPALLSGKLGPIPTVRPGQFSSYADLIQSKYTPSSPTVFKPYQRVDIKGFQITDRTIYVKVLWFYSNAYSYYSGSDWEYRNAEAVDIRSYDRTTGQFLGSTLLNGQYPYGKQYNDANMLDYSDMMPSNRLFSDSIDDDLLVLSQGSGEYQQNGLIFSQINRMGQVIKTVPYPSPNWVDPKVNPMSNCYTKLQKSFRGGDGEFYMYESASCAYGSSTLNASPKVAKINKDLSLAWRVNLKGTQLTYAGTIAYALGDHADAIPLLIDNPSRNQILVRSYSPNGFSYDTYHEALDKLTGSSTTSDAAAWTNYTQPTINFDGSYGTGIHTIDGYSTKIDQANSLLSVLNGSGTTVVNINGLGGIIAINGPFATTNDKMYGAQYVGDAMLLTTLGAINYGYDQHAFYPWLAIGTPTTTSAIANPLKLGQFVSNISVTDAELQFTINMTKATANANTAGFSFRMQDPKNRYAAETNGSVIYLSKYVGGVRTVLASANYPFLDNTDYAFTVSMLGNQIDLRLNGVPYLSVQDNTWLTGTIGPFTDKSYVTFSNIGSKPIKPPETAWYAGFALWESGSASATVKYDNISYTDSENDPASGSYQWFYKHTAKFLNNQGISALDGQTYSGSQTSFDKMGVYDITLSAKDDPNPAFLYPSVLFESYRKVSNTFHSSIVVHRPPVIPNFTNAIQGDGTVVFTDDGYDPDRYDPSTSACSVPDTTGINYCANRGIVSKQYYFVDPNGNYTQGKPTRPAIVGTYTVYLQVVDEYGALSNPASTTFTTATAIVARPPIATLTVPSGTFASPTMVGLKPDITWNQTDPDGYALINYQVQIFDSTGTLVVDSGIVNQNQIDGSQTWSIPTNLTLGVKYQVKVRVKDVYNWSSWSNFQWMQINSPPVASMIDPSGSQLSPTIYSTLRPTLKWRQTDPDPGTTFTYFQILITNEANNIMILDSGQYWQGSKSTTGTWTVNGDLPTGQKLRVMVRTFDGYMWSDYSTQTWFYINRAPVADFTWQPKPVWEGDVVSSDNMSYDPDGDVLTYTWLVEQPNGSSQTFTTANFNMPFLSPGDYTVTLSVMDGRLTSSKTKVITVSPLTIQSEVMYTDNWLILHTNKGHQTHSPPKQFYSGEIFVVATRSAAAPVEEVTAWIDTIGIDGRSLYVSQVLLPDSMDSRLYHGELFDQKFQSFTEGLPKGMQTIHFQIRYHNGVVKVEDIPIEIIGNVEQSVGVHRVQ